MTGKVASAEPSIGAERRRSAGGGSAKDLETLFQLIYLRFTQPRADPEIFKTIIDQTRIQLTNQMATPGFAFSQALNDALTQGTSAGADAARRRSRSDEPRQVDGRSTRTASPTRATSPSSSSARSIRRRSGRSSSSTSPRCRRSIARKSARDFDIKPAPGITTKRVEKGIEPKADTRRDLHRAVPVQPRHPSRHPRDGHGRSRAASATPCAKRWAAPTASAPRPATATSRSRRYTLQIGFGSDPTKTDALVARVFEEIDRLKTNGPTATELNDVQGDPGPRLRVEHAARTRSSRRTSSAAIRAASPSRVSSTLDKMYRAITAADDPGGGEAVPGHPELRAGAAVPAEVNGITLHHLVVWPSGRARPLPRSGGCASPSRKSDPTTNVIAATAIG